MRHYPVESLKAFMERRGLRTTSDSRSGGNPETGHARLQLQTQNIVDRFVWAANHPFAADLMACAETNS